MENKLNENLTNIRNFYHLICTQGNASQEEVYNFLHNLLEYVFNKNDLCSDDFEVNIHFEKCENRSENTGKQMSKEYLEKHILANNAKAYMQVADSSYMAFNVYFPNTFKSFKITSPFRYRQGEDKEQAFKDFVQPYKPYFDFIFSALHEYSHIMQYVLHTKRELKADRALSIKQNYLKTINEKMPACKDKRVITRMMNRYFEEYTYVAPCELDAHKQATKYYFDLIEDLFYAESDMQLKQFLNCNCVFVERIRRKNRTLKHIHFPRYLDSKNNVNFICDCFNNSY